MGILNVTDDSFYDGGRFVKDASIYKQAEKLLAEGADIIDIGGYSSRPHATDIPEAIETQRVLKGLNIVKSLDPNLPVSIDTFRSTIASVAVEHGADIINDISGGNMDAKMFETIAQLGVPYIMMHMIGTPQTMTSHTDYKDMVMEMLDYFSKKTMLLTQFGVKDVIIDVGFGFSKTIGQNFNLLASLKNFRMLHSPLMVGISRKSMIYKTLETSAENALNGTTALNTVALLNSAQLLRVHDVKEAKQVIKLLKMLPH
ncbi:MAG: dihydropteroate synthase [Cyclobacteriaceae bacterium]|nr:dihydropteroate synthase [Cyclobacteriaceae bacterium]